MTTNFSCLLGFAEVCALLTVVLVLIYSCCSNWVTDSDRLNWSLYNKRQDNPAFIAHLSFLLSVSAVRLFVQLSVFVFLWRTAVPVQRATTLTVTVADTPDRSLINPLKPNVIIWLHFEYSAPHRPNLLFLISDIRALWRSELNARVPECQKLKR